MRTSNKTSIWLFLISFALVFYEMSASFVERFVNYPTCRLIGANEFRTYHQALGPLVIGYMVIPKLITTLLTVLLLWFRPVPIPRWGNRACGRASTYYLGFNCRHSTPDSGATEQEWFVTAAD
jgi:hypothetical protein